LGKRCPNYAGLDGRGVEAGIAKAVVEEDTRMTWDKKLIEASKGGDLVGVKEALANGADIHVANDNALRWASHYGQPDVVDYLLANGANLHVKDDFPLRCASQLGHQDVVDCLKKWMRKEKLKEILG
jgi:hypothetical protein